MTNSEIYQNQKSSGYTVIELAVAVGILTTVIGCFALTMRGIHEMEKLFQMETKAIVLLNNTIERLEAQEKRDINSVRWILNDEFKKNSMSSGLTPICKIENAKILICVTKKNGKPVAELKLGR